MAVGYKLGHKHTPDTENEKFVMNMQNAELWQHLDKSFQTSSLAIMEAGCDKPERDWKLREGDVSKLKLVVKLHPEIKEVSCRMLREQVEKWLREHQTRHTKAK